MPDQVNACPVLAQARLAVSVFTGEGEELDRSALYEWYRQIRCPGTQYYLSFFSFLPDKKKDKEKYTLPSFSVKTFPSFLIGMISGIYSFAKPQFLFQRFTIPSFLRWKMLTEDILKEK